jgi:hypothetical protein
MTDQILEALESAKEEAVYYKNTIGRFFQEIVHSRMNDNVRP